MNSITASFVSFLVVCLMYVSVSAAPAHSSDDSPNKEELLFLAKLLGPLKELAEKTDSLEAMVEKAAAGKLHGSDVYMPEYAKRQGAWDMDYGWGGGRFGKRNGDKRYDIYGMSGRFGRDTARLSQQENAKQNQ